MDRTVSAPLATAPASAFTGFRRAACPHTPPEASTQPSPISGLTTGIIETYKRCNPAFKCNHKLPQRILTNPTQAHGNDGLDNADANLICRVNDELRSLKSVYVILDLLGTGTFGQVFRCQKVGTKEVYAVKVIKNKQAYHTQGMLEIKIAKLLNSTYDPKDEKHIVRIIEYFEFKNHICLVFELLSMSLLDILTQNQFRGLPLSVVQRFTKQILISLQALQEANVVHCDLKPENILLSPLKLNAHKTSKDASSVQSNTTSKSNTDAEINDSSPVNNSQDTGTGAVATEEAFSDASGVHGLSNRLGIWSDIKLIDFGSACFEGRTTYAYIQSRFYRSPEILLGVPYNGAIDMWSLACVCAEMYLGLPLFPGVSQHNQLSRIVEMLGQPPDSLIEGKNGFKYFTKVGNDKSIEKGGSISNLLPVTSSATSKYRLKTPEEYAAETKTEIPALRKYLRYSRLEDVILKCPLANKSKLSPEQKKDEMNRRMCFLDFLKGLFSLNPLLRWTAKQAACHPFITNAVFTGPYTPPFDPRINERKLLYIVQSQQKTNPVPGQLSHKVVNKFPPGGRVDAASNAVEHKFVPLSAGSRRTTEPISATKNQMSIEKLDINENQTAKVESDEKSDRPMLQRGQTVYERSRTISNDNSNNKHRHAPQAYYSPGNVQRGNSPGNVQPGNSPGNVQRGNHMHMNAQYKANHQAHQAQSLPVHAGHYIAQGSQGASFVTPIGFVPPQASYGYPIPPSHFVAPATYATAGYSNAPNINPAYVLYPPPATAIHPTQTAYSYTAVAGIIPQHAQAAIYVTQEGVPVQLISGSSSVGSNMSGYGGSLQEPGIMMTDFGQALFRPDLDESRRLQSHQYMTIPNHIVAQQPYWVSSSPVESQHIYHTNHHYHGYSRERGTSVTETDLRYVQGVASSAPSASHMTNQAFRQRRGSGNGLQPNKLGDLNTSNHYKNRSATTNSGNSEEVSNRDAVTTSVESIPAVANAGTITNDAINTSSDQSEDANVSKNEDDKVDDCDPFFAVDDEVSE